MTNKTLVRTLVFVLQFVFVGSAFAQSPAVKKAAQSVFNLTTFNADGTIHSTSHGVFAGKAGEGIAMWNCFIGANRAVIIDTKGKQYDVDAMLGISENYDICKFRIKDYNNASTALPFTTDNAVPASVYVLGYDLKKPDIKKISPERSEKFMTNFNYLVFNDVDVSASMLGCPIVNEAGQLLGIMQRPVAGGQAFSADTRLTDSLEVKGLSINDQSFRATGIRTALPADEKEASLMLVLAANGDSAKYERYMDDFIKSFPASTEGYNARAMRLVQKRDLAGADDMLETEVNKAEDKDVAYSNYAAIVYQASVYRIDSTFTKWNLERALDLIHEAEKIKPLPAYRHQEAQILFSQANYQQALDLFTELQKTELGKIGEIYYEAAQCKSMLKAPKTEIMALLDSAVNAQDGIASAPYVLARGQQYDNDGQYRKAFLDYMKYDSLMQNRASADFYYLKYNCEMKIHQYQLALNDIAHAIVINRSEPLYYAEMASLQLRVNKLDDAVKTCDMALKLTDKYPDLYIIKGIGLCEQKKNQEGLAAFRKAKELGDDRADKLIAKYSK